MITFLLWMSHSFKFFYLLSTHCKIEFSTCKTLACPKLYIRLKSKYLPWWLLAVVVFFACILGIFTRPLSYFSFFWPTNALLLGLLIRFPSLKNFGGILGAFIDYMGADLVTNNTLLITLGLTLSNFVAVFSGLFFFDYTRAKLPASNNNVSELYPHIIAVTLAASSALYLLFFCCQICRIALCWQKPAGLIFLLGAQMKF